MNRRAFCKTGLLAAGAVLCQPLSASVLRAGVLAIPALDPALARFILSYAPAYFRQGGSVLTATAGTTQADIRLVVQLGPITAFANAWQLTPPATPVEASGNFLTFTNARGQFVSVENLQPADYAARQQNLAAGVGVRFAHEAVTYTPATATYGDPFGATNRRTAGRLQMIPAAAADPVGTVLHGLLDSTRFGLTADGDFAALRDQTLATPPATAQDAARTATAFLTFVPALAAAGASGTITSLLGTPWVASSLASTYGLPAARTARSYALLRTTASATASDGAIWLATLLGDTIRQGKTGITLTDADPFVAAQARAALAQARKLAFS